ncbi:MAG: carbohydrate ABC transporter permease [Clostridia bacterium]|nr:carbohydrate ABC transporter permease [Clostridia bacterium]
MASGKGEKRTALLFLVVLGIIWFAPIIWLVLNSFKTDSEFITSFTMLKNRWDYLSRMIPRRWTTENYVEIFIGGSGINTTSNILMMFRNSFIVSVAVTVLNAVVTSFSAFAYERLEFKGGETIFWTLMYLSMFPNVVNLLPMFRIATALGLVNNLNALIWPSLAGVFNIFLIRNFLKGIPKVLDEAASIDGASSFQVYLHIILPSIVPVMIVVSLFSFNGAWNDFLWPSIVMTDVRNQTITPGLRLLDGQYGGEWAHMIASCLVSMLPPFILYLVAQKYFLQGISVQAGVKG